MAQVRIALANVAYPTSREDAIRATTAAIEQAAAAEAGLVCFPECFVPGYRASGGRLPDPPPPDAAFQERAWFEIAAAARAAQVGVVLGTERVTDAGPRISAMVIQPDGAIAGFQDKVQLDPCEDDAYVPGCTRMLFQQGALTFGVSICHEGFRYPETVRWAAQRGAQLVFHPHLDWGPAVGHNGEPFSRFGDPENSFHEKAMLCRAAENTCYFASVNCAFPDAATTSAVVRPDGTLLCAQPRGQAGLLLADLNLDFATGRLARRFKGI